jgi:hypothetical protein
VNGRGSPVARRRIEVDGEAPRRAEIAVDGERASRERQVQLEVRRLAGRLRERFGEPHRDAREIRRNRDLRRQALCARDGRQQQRALPTGLAGEQLAVRKIERSDDGVDRDLAFGVDTGAITGHVGRLDARRQRTVEEDRLEALAAQRSVGERERAVDLGDMRAEAQVRELAVDDVEARRQPERVRLTAAVPLGA